MTQHAALSPERWARFGLAQQLLQIGAEMQRATSFLRPERMPLLRACYERALRLADLTVEVQPRPNLRRELLRWRGVVAGLYLALEPDAVIHRQALQVLLELDPAASAQLRYLAR